MDHTPITPETIAAVREQFPKHSLFQVDMPDGRQFIVRGSSFDEFDRLVKGAKGQESRLALSIVRAFTVYPTLDAQDMEYNQSGTWEPGTIMALSEKIQEVLGYSKEITVKKL